MTKYMTVRFALDGDWVPDNRGCKSIEQAWEATDDGSRWYFYPIPAVIRDNGRGYVSDSQRIVDGPDDWCDLGPMLFPNGETHEVVFDMSGAKGRSIRTIGRWLAAQRTDMIARFSPA